MTQDTPETAEPSAPTLLSYEDLASAFELVFQILRHPDREAVIEFMLRDWHPTFGNVGIQDLRRWLAIGRSIDAAGTIIYSTEKAAQDFGDHIARAVQGRSQG